VEKSELEGAVKERKSFVEILREKENGVEEWLVEVQAGSVPTQEKPYKAPIHYLQWHVKVQKKYGRFLVMLKKPHINIPFLGGYHRYAILYQVLE